MNKVCFCFIIGLLLCAEGSIAQLKVGIKAGYNNSNFSDYKLMGVDGNAKSGIHGGFMFEYKLPKLIGIEADPQFSAIGSNFSIPGAPFSLEQKYNLGYFELPVVAKFYFLKFFNAQVGPQLSILTSAKIKTNTLPPLPGSASTTDVKDLFKSSDVAGVAGIGFEIRGFYTTARYIIGFSDINDDPGVTDAINNRVLQISVGLWFTQGW